MILGFVTPRGLWSIEHQKLLMSFNCDGPFLKIRLDISKKSIHATEDSFESFPEISETLPYLSGFDDWKKNANETFTNFSKKRLKHLIAINQKQHSSLKTLNRTLTDLLKVRFREKFCRLDNWNKCRNKTI